MKKNIILKGVACVLAAGSLGLVSCSDDYLDLKPISSTSSSTVGESVEYCSYVVNSLGASMYFPISGYAINMANGQQGEATMMTRYGDGYGADAYYCTDGDAAEGDFIRLRYINNGNYTFNAVPYGFYYGIIGQANEALGMVDGAAGAEEERNFVKAQLLTFRAHAYFRLLQLYAPRWSDSENGEKVTVPLRLKSSTEKLPAAPMKEVLGRVYKDLEDAIGLFEKSGNTRRMNASCTDINIAYGTLARAALLKNDWATAEEAARNARKGYQIMSGDEYLKGFIEANNEWMWYGSNDIQDNLGYGYWGSFNACNGAYATLWQETPGAGSINMDLYRQMDPNDIRRQCYMTPDKLTGVDEADWYSSKVMNDVTMNFFNTKSNRAMSQAAIKWSTERTPKNVGTSFSGTVFNGYLGEVEGEGQQPRTPVMLFGAQFKFYGVGNYAQSQFPWMRAAEMYLIEAEAAAMQGHTQVAQQVIAELGAKRIPGYTCALTGQALIDEIRLQRRLELWGEGFNFHDLKRWELPIVRNAWVEGDVNSGNIPPFAAGTVLPNEGNHWVWCVPAAEYNYNDLIHEEDYRY